MGGDGPFTFIEAPFGHFYADPFVVEQKQRIFLFLEDYDYLFRSASLICCELSRTYELLEKRTIVQTPYHISYPQVFCFDGTYYLIPETAAANRVELYRAVKFPWEWKLDRILISGPKLHDPTHVVVNGKHWIFAGASSTGLSGHYDQLHLFHAPTIRDRFQPHARNPVKTDLTSTRPAGAMIVDGNCLIRPAQDCGRWYGCGLTFMSVDEISESAYSEHGLSRLPSEWVRGRHLGTHTFNKSENFEVIDVCSYSFELSAALGRIRSLARKPLSNKIQLPEGHCCEQPPVELDSLSLLTTKLDRVEK